MFSAWSVESYSIYDRKFDGGKEAEQVSKQAADLPPALSADMLSVLQAAVDAGVVDTDGYEPTGAGQNISPQKRYMCRKYFI